MNSHSRGSNARWIAITAIAPISWGANYYLIKAFLPPEYPFWGAALRALPAALLLFAIVRRLPHGRWWWRAPVLGLLNFSAFFVLIYVAAQLLPSSVAASIQALSPFALGLLGAAILNKRLTAWTLIGATAGLVGVLCIVGLSSGRIDPVGVIVSLIALLVFSVGSILSERWRDGTPIITLTAWQLLAGGIVLTAVAVVSEGAPPVLDLNGWIAVAVISFVATALAFVCWFSGLAHLPPGVVGTIGLLNPVTGVLTGTILAGELLAVPQWIGIVLVFVGIILGQRRSRHGTDPTGSEGKFS